MGRPEIVVNFCSRAGDAADGVGIVFMEVL
jgi:hypothetical protein